MYLDSAILVKLVVREPDTAFYVRLVDGHAVWTSELSLTEVFSALLRKEREAAVTAAHRRAAWRQIESDVRSARLGLVPVEADLFTRANVLLERTHPHVALRSLDAIHLASAETCHSWPLCSNDTRVRAAATLLAMPLTPLPKSP